MAKKKAVKKAKKADTKKDMPKPKPVQGTLKKKSGVREKKRKKKTAKKPAGKCFVMMPFKTPFDIYYTTIFKPAIAGADLEPIRADDLFRAGVIVADLWEMIQDCNVLLAEVTTKNANVFYELGLAHAIGKPVVLVSETMDDVPFDLQQLRVLLYDKDDPLWGQKLTRGITSALKETLASPIEAVPGIFRKRVESQAPEQDATIARIETLEQQMRSFRTQAILPRSLKMGPEDDLWRTEDWEGFDQWARRWHAVGVEADLLESIIKRHEMFRQPESREAAIKRVREAIS